MKRMPFSTAYQNSVFLRKTQSIRGIVSWKSNLILGDSFLLAYVAALWSALSCRHFVEWDLKWRRNICLSPLIGSEVIWTKLLKPFSLWMSPAIVGRNYTFSWIDHVHNQWFWWYLRRRRASISVVRLSLDRYGASENVEYWIASKRLSTAQLTPTVRATFYSLQYTIRIIRCPTKRMYNASISYFPNHWITHPIIKQPIVTQFSCNVVISVTWIEDYYTCRAASPRGRWQLADLCHDEYAVFC